MCVENQQVTKSDFLLRITPTHRKAKNQRLEFLTGDFSKISENGSFLVKALNFYRNIFSVDGPPKIEVYYIANSTLII